jgi:hypothetical protein
MAARATINHDQVRDWVEARGGHPARVKGTNLDGDVGLLRIDYPGFSGEETLEAISWDDWFRGFEQHHLAFLYDPRPNSRFSKLVERDNVEVEIEGQAPPPPIDVIDLIQQQHDELRRCFREQRGPDDIIELLDLLSLHLSIEEAVVYPALVDTRLGDKVYESFEEHHNLMHVIADVIDGTPDERAIAARLRVLERLVEGHMQAEERDVLPKLRRLLNQQQRRQLADQMRNFGAELIRDQDGDAGLEVALSNADVPAPM